MSEHKPDSKLIETPVEEMCGNPNERKSSVAATEEVYGLKSPDGLSANGGIEFALVYTDINPDTKRDEPSDSAQFKGRGGKSEV
jgi:hypothetical protein